VKGLPPISNYPPELQPRCRVIAGSAWLVLGAGFFVLFIGSWGFLSAVIVLWALAAVPTAFLMIRWLRPNGGARVVAARLLFVCCLALAVAAVALFVPLIDWKRRLPYVVFWLPIVLSLWGAVLGFLGRQEERVASA